MTFTDKLSAAINTNNSLVCVGLDPDLEKMPAHIAQLPNPLYEFCKAIIDATVGAVCSFKPNSAFFERYNDDGMRQLKQITDYIAEGYPHIPIIYDAKRGDIGNTNNGYVINGFENLQGDAITVSPYMGGESLQPFLQDETKGCVVLCRTSNPGAGEFQDLTIDDGQPLFLHVADRVANSWNEHNNCLLVVGATYPDELKAVRDVVGSDMHILVPGIGAQGGDLEKTLTAGLNMQTKAGLIINSSRAIIYASNGEDFAEAAATAANELKDQINTVRG